MRFEHNVEIQGDDCVCHLKAVPAADIDKILPDIQPALEKLGFIFIPIEREFVCVKYKLAMEDQLFESIKPFLDKVATDQENKA